MTIQEKTTWVQVFDGGHRSGVEFYVQLKSVKNVRIFQDSWLQRLATKDILYWERGTIPVVLVVWDIASDSGRWIRLEETIGYLNDRRPNWRAAMTATIALPSTNRVDGDGLPVLRRLLADHSS